MGKLKTKLFDVIHDKKLPFRSDSSTYVQFLKQIPQTVSLAPGKFDSFGCCTSTASTRFHTPKGDDYTYEPEYAIVRYSLEQIPSTYRSLDAINEWLHFINSTFEFCNTKVIAYNGGITNEEYLKERSLTLTHASKNHVYIMYDKKFYPRQVPGEKLTSHYVYNFENLFTLSLIRYLASSTYFMAIHEILRVRKLKSLKDYSNWDILNIAKFANMDYIKSKASFNQSGFLLWDYRSPIYNRTFQNPHRSLEELYAHLKTENGRQNTACADDHKVLKLDVIYLMLLFQAGRYTKLFKLISNPKYHFDYSKTGLTTALMEEIYPPRTDFNLNHFINRDIDIKEYEKKL